MNAKTQIGKSVFANEYNYADGAWFRFWHPRKDAAMQAEKDYNAAIIAANATQDGLEAKTTVELSEQEKEIQLARIEMFKNVGIAAVFVAIIFVIIKM